FLYVSMIQGARGAGLCRCALLHHFLHESLMLAPSSNPEKEFMKVCVFGAGAIGGHAATRLIAARAAEVSVVTRGAQLEAIRARGLKLLSGGKEITGKPVAATDDPSTLPPQDVVIVTMKAHSLPAVAATLGRLVAPQGTIVF